MKTSIRFVLFLLFVFACYQIGNAQTYFTDDFEREGVNGLWGNTWDTLSTSILRPLIV
ncbi:MAG: hypothetical protein IPG99_08035 [Ignavibacteria bacterium]|nr:hypothetical protein [Ignavibacteria bacterium]